jgi:hypothetical protein
MQDYYYCPVLVIAVQYNRVPMGNNKIKGTTGKATRDPGCLLTLDISKWTVFIVIGSSISVILLHSLLAFLPSGAMKIRSLR